MGNHYHLQLPRLWANVCAWKCFAATGPRRSWSAAEKATSIAESYGAGETVCGVARHHSLTSQRLFTWRRLARQTALSAPAIFVPAVEPAETGGCVAA